MKIITNTYTVLGLIFVLIIAGCGSASQQQKEPQSTPQVQPPSAEMKTSTAYKGVFAYSQVNCDGQTKQLSFTLYNIFDHPINLQSMGENDIQIFLNSVPLTGLSLYCGADTIQPGEHADCYWSPAISRDPRVVLEKPIAGVEYENTIAVRLPTYEAKTVFSCNQRHSTHFITSLSCDPQTQDVSFGIKNIFATDLYLKPTNQTTSLDVVKLRINNHPLSALAHYCATDMIKQGDSVDCVRKGSDDADKTAKPKGGDGKQRNDLSMEFNKYTSEVSFLC